MKEQEVISEKKLTETREQLNAALYERKHIYEQLEAMNKERDIVTR